MKEIGKRVLEVEANAIKKISERLDKNFDKAVELLFNTKGRVILTGIGKSGLIGRKIAATFTSTGTPSVFIHSTDAVHGDLGAFQNDDVVIVISYSGETEEVVSMLHYIKRIGSKLIAITGNPNSKLAKHSDVVLDVSVEREACPIGLVPTTSTTATLALGDALAVALMERKGFTEEDFLFYHPGGRIGKRLLKVKHLMHVKDEVPIVSVSTKMKDAIKEMTAKGFGVTSVVDTDGKLVGIITDGDLRRLLLKYGDILEKTAGECMKPAPITIDREEVATKALQIMEDKKITSLLIRDKDGKVEGIIHLHDLWRTELF